VIVGARSVEQLADNLATADVELSADEMERLAAPTRPPKLYPQWMMELQGGPAAAAVLSFSRRPPSTPGLARPCPGAVHWR
jgi:hypothetical protein